jgi:predicted dehydrogenase
MRDGAVKSEATGGAKSKKCEVCIVGCGLPGRGMGWFHALNILDGEVPSAVLTDVVEPWFLGKGANSPEGALFADWSSQHQEVRFHKSVADMPKPSPGTAKLALIAGRTADNPRLLQEVVAQGCQTVYLEKPGAPTVEELEQMASFSKSRGVKVYMGYNKCVTKYVMEALAQEKKHPKSSTTFVHSNDYRQSELPECFEVIHSFFYLQHYHVIPPSSLQRNSEGMLKNMAVHELCLLVTYYGLRADNIASIKPDADFSSCQTLRGFTDFDKLGFEVTTEEGQTVSVYADRCGGSYSEAIVRDAEGVEVFRSRTPDTALLEASTSEQAAHPNYMPYFILQHDDYITLKVSRIKDS